MHTPRGGTAFDQTPDELLVGVILESASPLAFRELYRRYATRIYRLARRLVVDEMDAEDVVQETWARALERLPSFRWRSQLGTWLCGITVNAAREVLQRRGRWRDVEVDDSHAVALPSQHLTHGIDLERAIALLAPGARAAFLLHDVEGFTHEEIAAQLGWTSGTSKTQLFRARRTLRVILARGTRMETDAYEAEA
jgi:RNA polymerase sigma-70 factor (ECF subfamily)